MKSFRLKTSLFQIFTHCLVPSWKSISSKLTIFIPPLSKFFKTNLLSTFVLAKYRNSFFNLGNWKETGIYFDCVVNAKCILFVRKDMFGKCPMGWCERMCESFCEPLISRYPSWLKISSIELMLSPLLLELICATNNIIEANKISTAKKGFRKLKILFWLLIW